MSLNMKHLFLIAVGFVVAVVCLIGAFKTETTNSQYQRLSTLSNETLDQAVNQGVISVPDQAPGFEMDSPSLGSTIQNQAVNTLDEIPIQKSTDFAQPVPQLSAEHPSDFQLAPAMIEAELAPLPEQPMEILEPETTFQSSQFDQPQVDTATDQSAAMLDKPKATATPIGSSVEEPKTSVERRYQEPDSRWTRNPYVDESAMNSASATQASLNAQVGSEGNQQVLSLNVMPAETVSSDMSPTVTPDPSVLPESVVQSSATLAPVSMELSDSAAQQAVHHIEYGKSLSRRGATFAARQEFLTALRVIAQNNDAMIGRTDFSSALANAIRAMKESEDFVAADAEAGMFIDVAAAMDPHQTRVMSEQDAKRMTPQQVESVYLGYAAQQLDLAGGRNVVAAEALHCLGKLHTFLASGKKSGKAKMDMDKAIVFHQSSLQSNPNNPSSANELGVLMAKTGRLQQATQLFKRSLVAQSTPQAWSNLAKTHQRLGEQQMASLAQTELAIAANENPTIATAGIQWVQVPQFNAMVKNEFEPRIATNTQSPPVPQAAPKVEEPEPDVKTSIGQKIKSAFTLTR